MSFLRWFAREGFRTLKYVFRGIFRSLLRYVPCTMHPPLFSHPLRVNGMAGVSLAPMPPRHCAENGRCAVCSTPASSGGPGRTPPPVSTCPLAALQGGYLLPSPNSQTAETKVSRRDDFSCRNAGFPGPGESGPGAFTCSAGNRNMVNGIFPRTYVPECEAPFTPATVYRLALVGDKPKKAGHLSVTRMTGFRGCRSSPDVRGRRQGTTTS